MSSGESHSMAASDTTTSDAVAQRERHDRQQALHEVEVGDGAGDHLPGAQRVLPLAVEPLDGGEHLAAQVVLHVEREPAAEVAAQERRREPDDGEPEERRRRSGPSVAVEPATAWSTADRVSSGPTASRLTPSADATRAVIATPRWRIAGAEEAADPAGGGSVVHGLHVKHFSRE